MYIFAQKRSVYKPVHARKTVWSDGWSQLVTTAHGEILVVVEASCVLGILFPRPGGPECGRES